MTNDLTTDTEILHSIEAARAFDEDPRVVSAEYIGGSADLFIIRLSNGGRLAIPREELQGLEHASEAQAADIEVWGGGISLAWPQLDVDHYLPHLLRQRYGSDAWMARLKALKTAA